MEKEREANNEKTNKSDNDPTEKQKQKTAKKENTKATNMSYLLDSRINDYSFLHFPKKLLEELLGKRHGIAD